MALPLNSIHYSVLYGNNSYVHYNFNELIKGQRIGIIKGGVESGAFEDNDTLEKVFIPHDCVSVGTDAFNCCVRLFHVELPYSLETIEEGCFSGCISLFEIVIPKGTLTIESRAFEGTCINKLTLSIENLETIGSYAFDTNYISRRNRTCYVGNISTLDHVNKFSELNGWTRIANYQCPISDCEDTIQMELTYPPGEVYQDKVSNPIKFRETQPTMIRYLGSGEIITLATLDGSEYKVTYDFGKKSLQAVAKNQYPNELSDPWTLEFPWEEEGQKNTNSSTLLEKLLSKEWDIEEPILINWD